MEGVNNAEGDLVLMDASLNIDAEEVASLTNDNTFIATKNTVVGINIFIASPGFWIGDIPQILHNAALWNAESWISAEPMDTVIPAGSSLDIAIKFNAKDLYGGDYEKDIITSSNDPVNPEVIVPAHMHVTGIPQISVSADT
ncbi:unnamed protein product, partial [marine sediment metagenome]